MPLEAPVTTARGLELSIIFIFLIFGEYYRGYLLRQRLLFSST
jgi:hypothetical protein